VLGQFLITAVKELFILGFKFVRIIIKRRNWRSFKNMYITMVMLDQKYAWLSVVTAGIESGECRLIKAVKIC